MSESKPFGEHTDYYMIEVQTATGWAPFRDMTTHLPVNFETQEAADEEALGISHFKPLVTVRVLHIVHNEDTVSEFLEGKTNA